MRITRLGAGVDATGSWRPRPSSVACRCCGSTGRSWTSSRVVRGRLAATSAARDASNGAEFLAAAGEVTGIEPRAAGGHRGGAAVHGRRRRRPRPRGGPVPDPGHRWGIHRAGGRLGPGRPRARRWSPCRSGACGSPSGSCTSDPPTADELEEAEAMVDELLDAGHRRSPPLPGRPPPGRPGRHGHHPGLAPPGARRLRPRPGPPRRARPPMRSTTGTGPWPAR